MSPINVSHSLFTGRHLLWLGERILLLSLNWKAKENQRDLLVTWRLKEIFMTQEPPSVSCTRRELPTKLIKKDFPQQPTETFQLEPNSQSSSTLPLPPSPCDCGGFLSLFCSSSSFVDKPTHPLRSSRVIVPWKGFFFACLICQPSTTQPPTKEEVPQAVLEGPFIARNHQLFWSLPAPTPQSLVPLAVGGRDDLLECESTFLLDLCGWGRGGRSS